MALLDFQSQSEPLSWSVVVQGSRSDIQLLDSKSLFWTLLAPHKISAWSFLHPVYALL